jgi:ubiquinone/menaquinone biosynthesis C-methylase UbiE
MTWEETILYIRTLPEFKELVEKAYLEEDLTLNLERFRRSEEYTETVRLLKKYAPKAKSLLDIGAGNGISSIALALDGYQVTVIEPDLSQTVGAGAIQRLAKQFACDLSIHTIYAEELPFKAFTFDVVYARQAMHHAADLEKFVSEAYRVLKQHGIFFTVRDHVANTAAEKKAFLQSHPLQKYYGGENAFSQLEYEQAFTKAGFQLLQTLKYYDSVINYFPITKAELNRYVQEYRKSLLTKFLQKGKAWKNNLVIKNLYKQWLSWKNITPLNESSNPGKVYSFLCRKQP